MYKKAKKTKKKIDFIFLKIFTFLQFLDNLHSPFNLSQNHLLLRLKRNHWVKSFIFCNMVLSSEEISLLTTFYGLYFFLYYAHSFTYDNGDKS